jgi:3-oxoacyl-[acyl-carrier protein] reductase
MDGLTRTKADVQARLGRAVRCIGADVGDWNALQRGVAQAMEPEEPLRGVVNNAGVIEPIDRVEDTDPAAWAKCIQINLVGAYHVLRICLPHLAPGSVVANISSGAACAEHAGWSAYAASKAGLERLSATLANERPDLVVLAIRPGVTATDMQRVIKASRVDNAIRQLAPEALQPVETPARAIARLFTGALTAKLEGVNDRVVEARALRDLTGQRE